jgi:D-xylose transport system ATP-binding protein
MPLLEIKNLSKDFPGVRALDGVSLSLEPGEVHALCGENGAGKSTLLKILAGCHVAGSYGGDLVLNSQVRHFKGPRDAEEAGVALVAQELALAPELSITENICLGHEPKKGLLLDWEAARARAKAALERVGLEEDPSTPVGSLSVGKQQLVEIAKALSKQAKVLILDEPSAALSEADVTRLLALVKGLASSGVGILYVSHHLDEVFEIANSITVLRDGKSIKSGPSSQWTKDSVVKDMVGRELAEADAESDAPPRGALALELEGWSLAHPTLPGRFAVENLSLKLHAGEILGLGGLMGAGRTALLSSLFGAARSACQGRLRLGEGPWRGPFAGPGEAADAGLGLVSEDRKRSGLVLCASVKENLALASLSKLKTSSGLMDWSHLEAESEAQRTAIRIKTASLDIEVGGLSGGNQQKVVLGRWLMAKSRILLLDEPTRGVDVGAKAEIHRLIRSLAAQGVAVLLASSDLPELLSLSHRIMVLSQGKAKASLERDAFSPEAVMKEAI